MGKAGVVFLACPETSSGHNGIVKMKKSLFIKNIFCKNNE
jgi:hypothetical protein